LGKAHARELWALAGEAAGDAPRLEGVRLLAPGDPVLLGRDREALLEDPALRKQVWAAAGGAGIVMAGGSPVALWRARKQGKRLEVTVDAFGELPEHALVEQAERLAPHRGCTSVEVRTTSSSR
jgi:hypothetical protein